MTTDVQFIHVQVCNLTCMVVQIWIRQTCDAQISGGEVQPRKYGNPHPTYCWKLSMVVCTPIVIIHYPPTPADARGSAPGNKTFEDTLFHCSNAQQHAQQHQQQQAQQQQQSQLQQQQRQQQQQQQLTLQSCKVEAFKATGKLRQRQPKKFFFFLGFQKQR